MFKGASRNLQRRSDKGLKPRRGMRSSFANNNPTGVRPSLDSKRLNNILQKEAKERLREAPVASAPISAERAADQERVKEIRRHQKEEKAPERQFRA
jgi:hypothetical protein